MQPLAVGEKTYRHELGEQHSQSIGNNHEYTIIDNGNQQSSRRTEVSMSAAINYAGRKRATKNCSEKRQSHNSNGAAEAV